MTPDLSYYWEGGREGGREESNARTINGGDERKKTGGACYTIEVYSSFFLMVSE